MKSMLVRLRIRRTRGWQEYVVQAPTDGYVLDAIEAAGAQDATLLFRHACHHASCGSCGVRINGREALACITPLKRFKTSRQALRVEPLRNFPIIGDLLVDMGPFLRKLDRVDMPLRREAEPAAGVQNFELLQDPEAEPRMPSGFNRFENCIECGLCVSACPVAGLDAQYAGPALLAAAGRIVAEPRGRDAEEVLREVDHEHGLWRCHATFECSEVCPANVEPAREIMALRSGRLRAAAQPNPKGNG